jgi:hypothetical protein
MPNGKPGDHPWTDVTVHRRRVYSERADSLIREIAELAGDVERQRIADMLLSEYNEFSNPDVKKLEHTLTDVRERLRRDADERGWEVP